MPSPRAMRPAERGGISRREVRRRSYRLPPARFHRPLGDVWPIGKVAHRRPVRLSGRSESQARFDRLDGSVEVRSGKLSQSTASMIVADAHRPRGVARSRILIRRPGARSRSIFQFSLMRSSAGRRRSSRRRSRRPVQRPGTPLRPTRSPVTPTRTTAPIDLKHAVIMDVEATTTIRQEEVGAAKTMLDRTAEQFDVIPSRLIADGATARLR